jgi:hypothetical protein
MFHPTESASASNHFERTACVLTSKIAAKEHFCSALRRSTAQVLVASEARGFGFCRRNEVVDRFAKTQ